MNKKTAVVEAPQEDETGGIIEKGPPDDWKSDAKAPDGRQFTPAEQLALYRLCEPDAEMLALKEKANMTDEDFHARAREFNSVYPTTWRALFVADLQRRVRGDLFPSEKGSMGRNPLRDIEKLAGVVDAALEKMTLELRLDFWKEMIDHLSTWRLDERRAWEQSRQAHQAGYVGTDVVDPRGAVDETADTIGEGV